MRALSHVNVFLVVFFGIILSVVAHKHHGELTEEERKAPVDAILWIHMIIQTAVWGVIFPIGMVLGLAKSRWHVPLQSAGFALTFAGYFLGHLHNGRVFLHSVHGTFANVLFLPISAQLALGIYLKLHIHERTIRPYAVHAHGFLGKSYPILGWVQMLFGAITFREYCRGGHLGQCLAHYIMGGGFIAYGIIMTIMLIAGEAWIRRSGRSPEWWDSWIIMLWGIVNTFTEHHGGNWSHKDLQHTTLGIIWWAGGLLGLWLSRNNQRTVVPSIIVMITGWAMSQHAQALEISTKVHAAFGGTLILAGLARIIEVCFIAPSFNKDLPTADSDRHSDRTVAFSISPAMSDNPRLSTVQPFRHLPPLLLIAGGLLFMSATDEELEFAHSNGMDHVTYILLMFSLAFLIYTFVLFLINLWATVGRNAVNTASSRQNVAEGEAIELDKWYQSVPAAEADAEEISPQFVVGESENER